MTSTAVGHVKRPTALVTAIRRGEESRAVWCAVAPADHTIEDALHPAYLGARIKQMQPGDQFEVRSAAHKFLVTGYIAGVDRDASAISYFPLAIVDFTEAEAVAADWEGATVSDEGGHHRWSVRLGSVIAKSGFPSELAASEWLRAKQELARSGRAVARAAG